MSSFPIQQESTALQQGQESRSTVLPNEPPKGLGFLGSPYSTSDSLLAPAQIGVRVGDSLGDVMGAVKGVAFYADTIGFGASSTSFTKGMPLKPLGINYFVKNGQQCSNGADMYTYIQGIPDGSALGKKVQKAMADVGLPPLRGLAPGMLEDAKAALDPEPLMTALFGSGYPQCRQVTLPVGDSYGKIQDDDGTQWIEDPQTAFKRGDLWYQRRWVQNVDRKGNPINLTKEQWEAAPKTHNEDGTPIKRENFSNPTTIENPWIIGGIAIVALFAFGLFKPKNLLK